MEIFVIIEHVQTECALVYAATDITRECIAARDTFALLGSSEYRRSGSWTACQVRSTYTPGSVVILQLASFKSAIVVTLQSSGAVVLLPCHYRSYDTMRRTKMHQNALISALNYYHKFSGRTAFNQHSGDWLQPPRYHPTLALKPLSSLEWICRESLMIVMMMMRKMMMKTIRMWRLTWH